MPKANQVERINYVGGLYGLIAGNSRGKLQSKIDEMNQQGWNLHCIHSESINLIMLLFRMFLLFITLGFWTIGSSELLIFEKDRD